jgi:hypothetical protein
VRHDATRHEKEKAEMKKMLVIGAMAVSSAVAFGQGQPPTSLEVANTVSNLWQGRKLSEFSVYATNLYANASNYVPAIVVSAFHDAAFLGKLQSATNKCGRIQKQIVVAPQAFPIEFKEVLSGVERSFKEEIDMHTANGRTPAMLEATASPQAAREACGDFVVPHIFILYYAPAVTLP